MASDCPTTTLPSDHTLYRIGFMSGAHENSIENASKPRVAPQDGDGKYLFSALERELVPAIAHFLVGAAYTSERILSEVLGGGHLGEEKLEATFVRVEARHMLPISGGFLAQGRPVPCVVGVFKSEAMATRRADIHAKLAAAGITVLELFEGGGTYPEGHMCVLMETHVDDAAAAAAAAAFLPTTPGFAETVQETTDFLSAITPHGLCCGL